MFRELLEELLNEGKVKGLGLGTKRKKHDKKYKERKYRIERDEKDQKKKGYEKPYSQPPIKNRKYTP